MLGLSIVAFGAPLCFGYALRAARASVHQIPALVALVVSGLLLIAVSVLIVVIVLHAEFGLWT